MKLEELTPLDDMHGKIFKVISGGSIWIVRVKGKHLNGNGVDTFSWVYNRSVFERGYFNWATVTLDYWHLPTQEDIHLLERLERENNKIFNAEIYEIY